MATHIQGCETTSPKKEMGKKKGKRKRIFFSEMKGRILALCEFKKITVKKKVLALRNVKSERETPRRVRFASYMV